MRTKVAFLTAVAILISVVMFFGADPVAATDKTVIVAQGKCGEGACEPGTPDISSCSMIRFVIGLPFQNARGIKIDYSIVDTVTWATMANNICNDLSIACTTALDLPGVGIRMLVNVHGLTKGSTVPWVVYCRQTGGS